VSRGAFAFDFNRVVVAVGVAVRNGSYSLHFPLACSISPFTTLKPREFKMEMQPPSRIGGQTEGVAEIRKHLTDDNETS